MTRLRVEGKEFAYASLRIDLPPLDLLEWLRMQKQFPKVYWEERDSHIERAAVGSLVQTSSVPSLQGLPEEVRFFGGRQFAPFSLWQELPHELFWLPECEIVQTKEQTYLQLHFLDTPSSAQAMGRFQFDGAPKSSAFSLLHLDEVPSFAEWDFLCQEAMKQMKKVVLARETRLFLEGELSPTTLLAHLKAPLATHFLFQWSAEHAFLGATPERLYARVEKTLWIDALAGTRSRGASVEEELLMQEELVASAKEQKEFAYVKHSIEVALTSLCRQLSWGEDRVFKGTHVQHLYNALTAHVDFEVSDQRLLDVLHPTAALGGEPQEAALQFLQKHEPFARGFYGAPIGWISSHAADFCVGIRSLRILRDRVFLFAGAGILPDSNPEREWEELDLKTAALREALQEVCAPESLVHSGL